MHSINSIYLLSLMEQNGLLIHNTAGDRYVANMEICIYRQVIYIYIIKLLLAV